MIYIYIVEYDTKLINSESRNVVTLKEQNKEALNADNITDNADEIQDGLFMFLSQGDYIVDTCAAMIDDKTYYLIDVYIYAIQGENAELMNAASIEKAWFQRNKDGIADYYDKQQETMVFDDREAFTARLNELITEYNHY